MESEPAAENVENAEKDVKNVKLVAENARKDVKLIARNIKKIKDAMVVLKKAVVANHYIYFITNIHNEDR